MKVTRNYIDVFFALVFIITLIIVFTVRKNTREMILYDYEVSMGKIVNYMIYGIDRNHRLTFEYIVDGVKYSRKISPKRHFSSCYKDIRYCSDKLFWIIYSPDNPKKSLINLKIEIQGMEDPPFPKNLDDFE